MRWLPLLLLLAGCAQPVAPAPPPTATAASCPIDAPPQSAEVTVSGYHLAGPAGSYREGGGYTRFEWSQDVRRLARLRLHLEWTADGPLTETLSIGIPDATRPHDYYAYGPYEGRSPIDVTLDWPDAASLGESLQVNHGAAGNQTPLGGLAHPGQPALLVVRETYDGCGRP